MWDRQRPPRRSVRHGCKEVWRLELIRVSSVEDKANELVEEVCESVSRYDEWRGPAGQQARLMLRAKCGRRTLVSDLSLKAMHLSGLGERCSSELTGGQNEGDSPRVVARGKPHGTPSIDASTRNFLIMVPDGGHD